MLREIFAIESIETNFIMRLGKWITGTKEIDFRFIVSIQAVERRNDRYRWGNKFYESNLFISENRKLNKKGKNYNSNILKSTHTGWTISYLTNWLDMYRPWCFLRGHLNRLCLQLNFICIVKYKGGIWIRNIFKTNWHV